MNTLIENVLAELGDGYYAKRNEYGDYYLAKGRVAVLVRELSSDRIRFEHYLPVHKFACELISTARVQELWEQVASKRLLGSKTLSRATPRAIQNLRAYLEGLDQAYALLDKLVSDERAKRARLRTEERELTALLYGLDASLKRGYDGSLSLTLHGLTAVQVEAIRRALALS